MASLYKMASEQKEKGKEERVGSSDKHKESFAIKTAGRLF